MHREHGAFVEAAREVGLTSMTMSLEQFMVLVEAVTDARTHMRGFGRLPKHSRDGLDDASQVLVQCLDFAAIELLSQL